MLQFRRLLFFLSVTFLLLALTGCPSTGFELKPAAFTLESVTPNCSAETPPTVSMRLAWASSGGASSYDIHRDGRRLESVSSTVLSYKDERGLVAGQNYSYVVTARNDNGSSNSQAVRRSIPSDICSDGYSPLPGDPSQPSPGQQLSAGRASSMALLENGTLMAWGKWASNTPAAIPGLSNIRSLAAGSEHFLVLGQNGSVWAWGRNLDGELGNGGRADSTVPLSVPGLPATSDLSAGLGHSLAVAGGSVYSWGNNDFGKLGNPAAGFVQRIVRSVPNLTSITTVAAGSAHSMALHSDGTVWTWGANTHGQLGNGSNVAKRGTPEPIAGLFDVTAITAGGSHSLALRNDGTVWAWGANNHGQLGLGSTENQNRPRPIPSLTNITSITAGGGHTLALGADGTVWGWGTNYYGQVGDGSETVRFLEPVRITSLSGVSSIAAGGTHSLAALSDGIVWAWGSNEQGQVGSGNAANHLQPVRILPAN